MFFDTTTIHAAVHDLTSNQFAGLSDRLLADIGVDRHGRRVSDDGAQTRRVVKRQTLPDLLFLAATLGGGMVSVG